MPILVLALGCPAGKSDSQALQAFGNIAVLHLFANAGQRHDGDRPANSRSQAECHAVREVVVPLDHEQGGPQDGAVHGQQGQKDAQRLVQRGEETVQDDFQDLDHRRDHRNLAQQSEEGEIHVAEPGPGQRALPQQVIENQVVDRDADGLDHDDGHAEARDHDGGGAALSTRTEPSSGRWLRNQRM